ncbi:unnamed protein product [marine sediment metagenome]|uniref:Uncharacterized protein n=1 Tax=marine sediment metagenome TaxID=412755 RepID=X1NZE2_9ZZZZ
MGSKPMPQNNELTAENAEDAEKKLKKRNRGFRGLTRIKYK